MKTSSKHEVDVTVERGNDSTFTAYISGENKLTFGILGDGNSVDEAINDLKESFEDMRKYYDKEGKEFPENVEFIF